ncbi:unnamed protein product [Linum trigynum]|uniref:Uncharacterized protein n=1 Tax=Linum trigynum TaxID=586398 RepID=A0AAV2FW14_9ROSI
MVSSLWRVKTERARSGKDVEPIVRFDGLVVNRVVGVRREDLVGSCLFSGNPRGFPGGKEFGLCSPRI